MKLIIYFIAFTLLSINSNAQVLQLAKADSLWHLKISAAGLYTDGNQPRSLFTNKANLTKVWKAVGLISNNTYQYGTVSNLKIIAYNDIRSENLLVVLPYKRLSPFIREFIETNKLRQIDFRSELAIGGIFKIVAQKSHGLNAMVGIVNQTTNYKNSVFNILDNGGSDKRNVWKWATGLTGFNTIVKDRLNAEYRLFYMQNVELANDYNYMIDLSLNAKIIKGLVFNVNYFQTFENVEMQNILPKEVQLTYGLSYQF